MIKNGEKMLIALKRKNKIEMEMELTTKKI